MLKAESCREFLPFLNYSDISSTEASVNQLLTKLDHKILEMDVQDVEEGEVKIADDEVELIDLIE